MSAMDIVLTHGYFLVEDAHEQQVMKPYPPLGLLYLSAYLKQAGFAVEIADSTFRASAGLATELAAHPAPVVGLYTNLMTRKAVVSLLQAAKGGGKTVVVGGPESANYPAEYLAAGADAVVFGEGEETLAELLPALATFGRNRLHGVAGIAFKDDNGVVVTTAGRPKLQRLDDLPWPDRAAIDLKLYLDTWRRHHGAGSINLITARGCPYHCRWCSHAVFGYHHARRSPANVADEVAHILEAYEPDQLWYADDVFNISHRWLGEYARTVRQRGLVRPFECIVRADRVTDEVVDYLLALGCYRVWIGSESGSQRILDAMERGVTVDEVTQAAKRFQRGGIAVGMFLMWGYHGETEADIEATIQHVKQTNPDVFLTTVAYPIKNTPYFDEVAATVRSPADLAWQDATDRDYRIAGRHSKRYYAFVTRRLKAEVALHRLRGGSEPPAPADRHGDRRGPNGRSLAVYSPRSGAQGNVSRFFFPSRSHSIHGGRFLAVLKAAAGVVAGRAGMRLTARETEA